VLSEYSITSCGGASATSTDHYSSLHGVRAPKTKYMQYSRNSTTTPAWDGSTQVSRTSSRRPTYPRARGLSIPCRKCVAGVGMLTRRSIYSSLRTASSPPLCAETEKRLPQLSWLVSNTKSPTVVKVLPITNHIVPSSHNTEGNSR